MTVRNGTAATALYATAAAVAAGAVAYTLLELAAWWYLSRPREDYELWRFAPR